jgi:hypothetical protein
LRKSAQWETIENDLPVGQSKIKEKKRKSKKGLKPHHQGTHRASGSQRTFPDHYLLQNGSEPPQRAIDHVILGSK